MIKHVLRFSFVLLLCGCSAENKVTDEEKYSVVTHYADLAHVIFKDSHLAAEELQHQVEALLNSPDDQHLRMARKAWLDARKPYLQSEAFRLGNPEFNTYQQRINGWPISASSVEETLQRNGEFTPASLPQLTTSASNANAVVSGYHVIEALLWGEGDRPATDFMANRYCTTNNKVSNSELCAHRRQYLIAASKLLVEDLLKLEKDWSADEKRNYRAEFLRKKLPDAYNAIFSGITSVLLGQLAGQQLKAPFTTQQMDQVEDNGSHNHHNTLILKAKGVHNIFYGSYTALDDTHYNGDNINQLLERLAPDLQQQLRTTFKSTYTHLQNIAYSVEQQNTGFSQLIAQQTPDHKPNLAGNQLIRDAIDTLVMQTHLLQSAASSFEVTDVKTDSAGFTF